jgi:hypothetical protein
MRKILLYMAGALTLVWGISHLIPTATVVSEVGDISFDNKMIITMEWIIEGVTLILIGILTTIVTAVDSESKISSLIYSSIAFFLLTLAIISLFTGFRIDFLPFKLCPVIFSTSAILILIGTKIKSKNKL